jgi:hypothetical protein
LPADPGKAPHDKVLSVAELRLRASCLVVKYTADGGIPVATCIPSQMRVRIRFRIARRLALTYPGAKYRICSLCQFERRA